MNGCNVYVSDSTLGIWYQTGFHKKDVKKYSKTSFIRTRGVLYSNNR